MSNTKCDNKEKGNKGEDLAAQFLIDVGYQIIKRNYRCMYGEIDIIAKDSNFLVFIEVKLRNSKAYGLPREAVGIQKQNKIKNTALFYLAANEIVNQDCRFDVVEVNKANEMNHIQNAFE